MLSLDVVSLKVAIFFREAYVLSINALFLRVATLYGEVCVVYKCTFPQSCNVNIMLSINVLSLKAAKMFL